MTYRLLSVSLATLTIVSACSPAVDETKLKNRFSEYEIVNNHQIEWSEVLTKKIDNYIVFVYSETCAHCHEMMQEIIDFATDDILPTFFVDTASTEVVFTKENEPIIGIDDLTQLAVLGTPSIIEVLDGYVVANIPGLDDCLMYLNENRKQISNN